MNDLAVLLGRIGLSIIFIMSGWGKFQDLASAQHYMQAMGVPGVLAPLVALVELLGGWRICLVFSRVWPRWGWRYSVF